MNEKYMHTRKNAILALGKAGALHIICDYICNHFTEPDFIGVMTNMFYDCTCNIGKMGGCIGDCVSKYTSFILLHNNFIVF